MTDPWGFVKFERKDWPKRPVDERVGDWREVYLDLPEPALRQQAARCMDCGIPFCHQGCPLGNLIPDWNDLVHRGKWREAIDRLHATNNFPEFTGKLCPAPCEGSCVLAIGDEPVTIKQVEMAIIDRAFQEGWVRPSPPTRRTGKRVAVVGSGPAGLAATQQLNQAGHHVTVFERDDRIGGLIRYGIPAFKMDKALLNRRLRLLQEEGIVFRPNVEVGVDLPADEFVDQFDAVVLAIGATRPRDLPIPGRELDGIHFAMDYLTQQNRLCEGDEIPDERRITAHGKRVVIIGGGDTGADCLGTAHRQGAASIVQFQRWPQPPGTRALDNPWPEWPEIFRVSPAHEEGGERAYAVLTREFLGRDGKVTTLRAARAEVVHDLRGHRRLVEVPGSDFELPVDLVLLAVGYAGPEPDGIVAQLSLEVTASGTIAIDAGHMTSQDGVFAAGDAAVGQSLVVTAIAEGRQVACNVDHFLAHTPALGIMAQGRA